VYTSSSSGANPSFGSTGALKASTTPVILDMEHKFSLPLFPLRKRVRFPTDELTLNLYEERYLSMSEYILFNQAKPIFGAIYSSDKPQLITRGPSSPVVPILVPGDIGVICLVHDWMDGMIPKKTPSLQSPGILDAPEAEAQNSNEEGWKRRIRLQAVAVGRFRIEKILHDGTTTTANAGSSSHSSEDNQPPPYIVVEASLITDDYGVTVDSSQIIFLEKELEKKMKKEEVLSVPSERTDSSYISDETMSEELLTTTRGSSGTKGKESIVDRICDTMVRYSSSNNSTFLEGQRKELLSFLAASKFLGDTNASPQDMQSLLRTTSLQERLDLIRFYMRR